MWIIIFIVCLAVVSIMLLKGFDKIAGRGPKQVSDGIAEANDMRNRVPCPMCAEMILPQAKICPFCKSEVKTSAADDSNKDNFLVGLVDKIDRFKK